MAQDIHAFPKFKHCPLELQGMIFKEAIPRRKSPVIDFFFEITKNRKEFILGISAEIPKAPHLLPLLNACEASRKEVYRQLKKVKISGPPNGFGSAEKTDDGVPVRYFWTSWTPISYTYTYIDPVRDTLMLNIPSLLRLYQYGGSIDFSKITRIALTAFSTDDEDASYDPTRYKKVLDLVGRICPDLKVFQMVTMLAAKEYYRESNPKTDYRILDLETEMWHTDFWDEWGIVKLEHENRIADVLDGAEEMGTGYFHYMAFLQQEGREKDLEFWKRLKYTPALHCRFDGDEEWKSSGKGAPEPRLYVLALDAWLPAYDDGTVLDKYKGLAQIFEGDPW
ncbi:hypothetical protein DSL72_005065 [Monilinia vaccinii-corymbosi]|uniref:Uncharacterized protein n=1 Tax=Monilinia vaccinii-corymbosi TaxID=61207 RepID=A0A8A3PE64_9HELO|nr:hypothetical protein DSL72_005065 [Monilinia vaccinii-corymbosi]